MPGDSEDSNPNLAILEVIFVEASPRDGGSLVMFELLVSLLIAYATLFLRQHYLFYFIFNQLIPLSLRVWHSRWYFLCTAMIPAYSSDF